MALDTKIKQAAVNTALRHQLKNLASSKERVCRNLIDFGIQLCSHSFTAAKQQQLYEELLNLLYRLETNPASGVDSIREWMNSTFLN